MLAAEFHLDAQRSEIRAQLPNDRFQKQTDLGFGSRGRFVFQASLQALQFHFFGPERRTYAVLHSKATISIGFYIKLS